MISCIGSVPDPNVEVVLATVLLLVGILQNGPQCRPPNRFNSNLLIFFLHTNMMKMIAPCKEFIILVGYQTISDTKSTSINHAINSKIQVIPITMNSFKYILNLWAKHIFLLLSHIINFILADYDCYYRLDIRMR